MNKRVFMFIAFSLLSCLVACSKKSHPASATVVKTEAPAATKPAKKAVIKTAVPKVIVVNDVAAKKSLDGRYYYDLEGHRYWRNNRDGKYYLFHKSMFDNPDFKAPGN